MDSGGAKAAKHDIKATKENKLPAGDIYDAWIN